MVQDIEVTILTIRHESIENKIEDTGLNTSKFQNLVVTIGEVCCH